MPRDVRTVRTSRASGWQEGQSGPPTNRVERAWPMTLVCRQAAGTPQRLRPRPSTSLRIDPALPMGVRRQFNPHLLACFRASKLDARKQSERIWLDGRRSAIGFVRATRRKIGYDAFVGRSQIHSLRGSAARVRECTAEVPTDINAGAKGQMSRDVRTVRTSVEKSSRKPGLDLASCTTTPPQPVPFTKPALRTCFLPESTPQVSTWVLMPQERQIFLGNQTPFNRRRSKSFLASSFDEREETNRRRLNRCRVAIDSRNLGCVEADVDAASAPPSSAVGRPSVLV